MNLSKITSKGQITLPVEIRKKLNLSSGDNVIFIEQEGYYIITNENNIVLKKRTKDPTNIPGIIASLQMEGLTISPESIEYANKRVKGEISYENHIAEILEKYK